MRKVKITKTEYDEFLFDTVMNPSPETEDEREVLLRVSRQLKDPTISEERPLSEKEKDIQEKAGRRLWKGRRLTVDSVEFAFQDDEYKLVMARLKKGALTISGLMQDEYELLLQRVKDAPEEKQGPRAVPDEPAEAAVGA